MKHTLSNSRDADGGRPRWYIDGRRVSFREFYELEQLPKRHDTFQTRKRGSRWLHSKVVTL